MHPVALTMAGSQQICTKQQQQNWPVEIAPGMNEPYTYHMPTSRLWCSYEDHDSVIIKVRLGF